LRLEDFLVREEGDDSRHLADGCVASTWDRLGHVWNIGPGLTHGVTASTVWTPAQLQAAEAAEYAATRAAVASLVKVPLGENRTTALESLTYNIGVFGFAHSTVLRDVNTGNFAAVPGAFRLWNKAGGAVCQGLINRRNDEVRLWLHPDNVQAPADLTANKNVPPAHL
jgi:lysozyme